MSLDVIILRNISFVGCILIIAATELSKISRSLFITVHSTTVEKKMYLVNIVCIYCACKNSL